MVRPIQGMRFRNDPCALLGVELDLEAGYGRPQFGVFGSLNASCHRISGICPYQEEGAQEKKSPQREIAGGAWGVAIMSVGKRGATVVQQAPTYAARPSGRGSTARWA